MNVSEGVRRLKTFANQILVIGVSLAVAVLVASSTLRVSGLGEFFVLLMFAALTGGVLRVGVWILEGFLQRPSAPGLPNSDSV